jgi:hypothetical protein
MPEMAAQSSTKFKQHWQVFRRKQCSPNGLWQKDSQTGKDCIVYRTPLYFEVNLLMLNINSFIITEVRIFVPALRRHFLFIKFFFQCTKEP